MPGPTGATGKGPYRHMAPCWKASIAVAVGDLIYRDSSGYDQPAGNFTWDTNIATTSAEFRLAFRGISDARRLATGAGETTDGGRGHGLILGSGEFQSYLDVTAAAVQVAGSFVSVAKASGNNLQNQTITLTATISNAIGVLTEDVRIGDVAAKWEVQPALAPWHGVQNYYANGQSVTLGVTSTAPTG
jgi:hypothetical protein